MNEVDIMNDLLFCINADCKECSRLGEDSTCHKKLLRDARSVIKMQSDALQLTNESLKQIEKDFAVVSEKAKVGYTNEQLVEAVNDIISCCLDSEDCDDPTLGQILAIGKFMRLVRLHGHIAVNCNADRMEIRLDK